MTDASVLVSARGLRKRFGALTALDGVDLDVAAGEVVALMGPNGAGKSTLVRILCTTVIADAGTAAIADVDVARDPVRARRHVGVVLSDERSWYWRLTGRQNLEFFCALAGLNRRAARARAVELLELVALTEAADRRFDGYSAGMRSRLSLARALLDDPPVLLLDEPTRALDPLVAQDLRAEIVARAAHGRAVLWVTHDAREAIEVADRVLLMHEGRIHATARRAEPDAWTPDGLLRLMAVPT